MQWENRALLRDSATGFLERKSGLRSRKPLSLRPKCNYRKPPQGQFGLTFCRGTTSPNITPLRGTRSRPVRRVAKARRSRVVMKDLLSNATQRRSRQQQSLRVLRAAGSPRNRRQADARIGAVPVLPVRPAPGSCHLLSAGRRTRAAPAELSRLNRITLRRSYSRAHPSHSGGLG